MKTYSIEWSPVTSRESRVILNPIRLMPGVLGLVARTLLALLPAVAIGLGATWLINLPEHVVFLQAALWAAGFVFVGLALDSESVELSILNLATGIALPVLALLSSRVAIEFAVVAATLVAAWVAAGILRR